MSQQMQGCLLSPAPSPGCIPALSLWEETCSWGTVWVKLCLDQEGRLVLHIWPKYQRQVLKREVGSSLGHLCHDKDDQTDGLASEDNHGDAEKSSIIFHAISLPSHCLCGKNSLGCFVDGVIYSPNTYCLYLYGYLLCSKENQWKIINPGGPLLSQKINKEFSLLCFQVGEERTIFITTDSSLPWSRKVFPYI